MKTIKKVVFLTGTRADFGKLKSLINICESDKELDVYIFVTGMHLQSKYGNTVIEIIKEGYRQIYKFINHTSEKSMDQTLAKTIQGFSDYINENKPDLIVIHGDRVEALAGAITGALNNILVAHIEGGEVSGTIDELIRHSVSKLSHIHFVSNKLAKNRLLQMGELNSSVFVIGSPDVDMMFSDSLPSLEKAKDRYNISYDDYAILMYHPITTELENISKYANNLVDAVIKSNQNYIVIYPNNDTGSSDILRAYKKFENYTSFKIYPSLRFEYFLTLLKHSNFIIGNSSAGIREAPYYGVPTVNIGSRQFKRSNGKSIIHSSYETDDIFKAVNIALSHGKLKPEKKFGYGNSSIKFISIIKSKELWKIPKQKTFNDIM